VLSREGALQAVGPALELGCDSGAATPLDQGDTQVQCGAVDEADAAHRLRPAVDVSGLLTVD
jgi:hypothetical protein